MRIRVICIRHESARTLKEESGKVFDKRSHLFNIALVRAFNVVRR